MSEGYIKKKIQIRLNRRGLDGLLLSSSPNISYFTDFTSRDAYLLISDKKNIYLTDSRYTEEAKQNLSKDITIKKVNGSVFKIIADSFKTLGLKRIGFEERHLTFGEYKKIKQELKRGISLIPTHSLIEGARQIKNEGEIKKIRKAVQITISALKFIQNYISVGRKETEVAGELERFIRYNGGFSPAFDIIVASGPNSSFPHHITSQRKLENHEPVLIDIGVDYLGYKSDLTRVFFLGKITSLFRKLYAIVIQAQAKAIKKIKPATRMSEIDAAARQYITQRGYGRFFSHNLGHGVGLEVHEDPHITSEEDNKLKPGMVFTIEPAIYLPGKFGVRIEDMALVTRKGVKVLSGALNK